MVIAQGLSANMSHVDGDIIYFNINYEELKNSDIYKYTARELEARQGWETPADYLERLFGDI